jgi:hypothetical protein
VKTSSIPTHHQDLLDIILEVDVVIMCVIIDYTATQMERPMEKSVNRQRSVQLT